MPMTIDGTPFSTSAVKRIRSANRPRPNSEGNTHDTSQAENQDRAANRIGHPAARFTYWLRSLGQKCPVQRSKALVEQVSEDGNEWQQYQQDGCSGCHGGQHIDYPASNTHHGEAGFFARIRHCSSLESPALPSTPATGREYSRRSSPEIAPIQSAPANSNTSRQWLR